MLVIKCDTCNKLVTNTKGSTDAERMGSLLTNFGNHLAKSHTKEVRDRDAELSLEIMNRVTFLLLIDNLTFIETTEDGRLTKELIEVEAKDTVNIICEALGIEEEEEEGLTEGIEGEIKTPEEGVITEELEEGVTKEVTKIVETDNVMTIDV